MKERVEDRRGGGPLQTPGLLGGDAEMRGAAVYDSGCSSRRGEDVKLICAGEFDNAISDAPGVHDKRNVCYREVSQAGANGSAVVKGELEDDRGREGDSRGRED